MVLGLEAKNRPATDLVLLCWRRSWFAGCCSGTGAGDTWRCRSRMYTRCMSTFQPSSSGFWGVMFATSSLTLWQRRRMGTWLGASIALDWPESPVVGITYTQQWCYWVVAGQTAKSPCCPIRLTTRPFPMELRLGWCIQLFTRWAPRPLALNIGV